VTPYRYPDARIAVLAKAPRAGQCKTRLIPALGAERAARLQSRLLLRGVGLLLAARLCPLDLWCDPTPDHPDFQTLGRQGAQLGCQSGTDLGERMAAALRSGLGTARLVVVIGSDIPDLGPEPLATAIEALLAGQDAVLGPVADGGYCLLGLRQPCDSLFTDMAWSTAHVADLTRQRLQHAGLRWLELPVLRDVDTVEDLEWLRATRPQLLAELTADQTAAGHGHTPRGTSA
jgi:rSAM/selenodomain-associated transferase 1